MDPAVCSEHEPPRSSLLSCRPGWETLVGAFPGPAPRSPPPHPPPWPRGGRAPPLRPGPDPAPRPGPAPPPGRDKAAALCSAPSWVNRAAAPPGRGRRPGGHLCPAQGRGQWPEEPHAVRHLVYTRRGQVRGRGMQGRRGAGGVGARGVPPSRHPARPFPRGSPTPTPASRDADPQPGPRGRERDLGGGVGGEGVSLASSLGHTWHAVK